MYYFSFQKNISYVILFVSLGGDDVQGRATCWLNRNKSYFFDFNSFRPVGQMSLFKHSEHFGRNGVHFCWPKPTNSQFISDHLSWGSQDSRATRVSSGVLVAFKVQPSLLEILWTCVSTPKYPKIKHNSIKILTKGCWSFNRYASFLEFNCNFRM